MTAIINQFEKYQNVITTPKEETLGWILHYMGKYNYLQILTEYGIAHLLIVMEMLENNNDFELCRKVVDTIEIHNRKNNKQYPTHISGLKKSHL